LRAQASVSLSLRSDKSTGREYQTLADYAWVAKNMEFSARAENLSLGRPQY
jgi:hypothetical protein